MGGINVTHRNNGAHISFIKDILVCVLPAMAGTEKQKRKGIRADSFPLYNRWGWLLLLIVHPYFYLISAA